MVTQPPDPENFEAEMALRRAINLLPAERLPWVLAGLFRHDEINTAHKGLMAVRLAILRAEFEDESNREDDD